MPWAVARHSTLVKRQRSVVLSRFPEQQSLPVKLTECRNRCTPGELGGSHAGTPRKSATRRAQKWQSLSTETICFTQRDFIISTSTTTSCCACCWAMGVYFGHSFTPALMRALNDNKVFCCG